MHVGPHARLLGKNNLLRRLIYIYIFIIHQYIIKPFELFVRGRGKRGQVKWINTEHWFLMLHCTQLISESNWEANAKSKLNKLNKRESTKNRN